MKDRDLDVYLDGVFCGRLTQTSSGNLTFAYDDSYRELRQPTPLSLSMPLSASGHKKRAVLPFLQGLLPDNDEALGAMARRFSVSANNPFALLEHVGADVAGAVQIVERDATASDSARSRTKVRPVTDSDISRMLDHVVAEYADGTPYYEDAGRFSLAGAQPKIALHKIDEGSWGVPQDATPTTHILKPVAGSFRRVDVVEQMTMHAAAYLGNNVAKSTLARIGEWDVFVSERYDRAVARGRWKRLHQEDFCQALSVSPSRKYQHRDGGPGIAEISGLIHSLPFDVDRQAAAEGFFRAFVFNIVAGCTDAHAKNYSLMLDGGSVSLAPLYDLLSYAAYWDGQARLDSAMSVDGEYSLWRIGVGQLSAVGKKFGVVDDVASAIVEDTVGRAVEAFESARAIVEQRGKEARTIADSLLVGLRKLPLVAGA